MMRINFKIKLSLSVILLAVVVLMVNYTCFAADGSGAADVEASVGQDQSWRARLSDWWVKLSPDNSLISAIRGGNLAGVQQALRLGANPNVRFTFEPMALTNSIFASGAGSAQFQEPILTHCIRYCSNLDIMAALLAAGADISQSTICSNIYHETDRDNIEKINKVYGPPTDLGGAFVEVDNISEITFALLLKQSLTPLVRNQALMAACRLGYVDIATQLITMGADLNFWIYRYRNNTVDTFLTAAIAQGRKDIVRLLIRHGANINRRTQCVRGDLFLLSPLACAVAQDQLELVQILLAAGADVAKKQTGKYAILNLVKSSAVLKILILAGVKVTESALRANPDVAKVYAAMLESDRRLKAVMAAADPEFGIEMVPMHGGMERSVNQAAGRHPLENENGGWSESKGSE